MDRKWIKNTNWFINTTQMENKVSDLLPRFTLNLLLWHTLEFSFGNFTFILTTLSDSFQFHKQQMDRKIISLCVHFFFQPPTHHKRPRNLNYSQPGNRIIRMWHTFYYSGAYSLAYFMVQKEIHFHFWCSLFPFCCSTACCLTLCVYPPDTINAGLQKVGH